MKRYPGMPSNHKVIKARKSFGPRPMFGTSLYDGTYANELSSKALLKGNYEQGDEISPAHDCKQSLLDVDEVVGEST